MNLLAHAYLSGNNEDYLVGNFIADSVKGAAINNFREGVKNGILLHRSIDTFTDTHPVVSKSKRRLHSSYHKYAGVLVDIFYDHFLAKSWSNYSSVELKKFSANVYEVLNSNYSILPNPIKKMLPFLIRYDWLTNYAHLTGIQSVLSGMSRRTSFVSNIEKAIPDFEKDYELFEKEFSIFFPQLIAHSTRFIEKLPNIEKA